MNLRVKIDVSKLDKTAFFHGKNGAIYCDLVIWENKGGEDQYGNSHSVKQDLGKDRRGEKTPYIGNAKLLGKSGSPRQDAHNTAKANAYQPQPQDDDTDDIPF